MMSASSPLSSQPASARVLAGNFAAATALFEDLSRQAPKDRPVKIYRTRCARSLKLGSAEAVQAEGGV
jgi:hypothetical protein